MMFRKINKVRLIITGAVILSLFGGFQKVTKKSDQRPELVYIYDPLCGWCYAFGPVIRDIKQEYGDRLQFTIMSGGLAAGERSGPVKEIFGDYLEHALGFVESKSDVPFGSAYKQLIKEGSYIYDSEPPSVALIIVKEMKPAVAFEYSNRLQQALFAEGKSLNDSLTYIQLSKEFGMDAGVFMRKFRDSTYRQAARQEFALSDSLGAVGYPTMILRNGNKISVITDGFQNHKRIRKKLEKELKRLSK